LSLCHINTRISKPVEYISWKRFLSRELSCQHCSCDKNCFPEMSSTGLEMRQNRFRLTGGAYSTPPDDPLAGGEGAGRRLPKNPTLPRTFGPRASAHGPRCLILQTPPKINPNYGLAGRFFGLVTKHACDRRTDRQTDRQTELRLPRPRWHSVAR